MICQRCDGDYLGLRIFEHFCSQKCAENHAAQLVKDGSDLADSGELFALAERVILDSEPKS